MLITHSKLANCFVQGWCKANAEPSSSYAEPQPTLAVASPMHRQSYDNKKPDAINHASGSSFVPVLFQLCRKVNHFGVAPLFHVPVLFQFCASFAPVFVPAFFL